ncbi:MAG: lysophospholipid acyltransferase family protein [Planctomycetota bacterium]
MYFSRSNWIGYGLVRFVACALVRPYFRLRLIGREYLEPGPVIVAPNHCSYLDPVVLQTAIARQRLVFLMDKAWYDRPLLNPFFRLMKCIPVDEDARNRSALEQALITLRQGVSVGIYPEGQVNPEGVLGKFSPGVASLALRAGVPIVPAGITGTGRALPKKHRFPRPVRVTVRLGPALHPLRGEAAQGMSKRAVMDDLTARLTRAVEGLTRG